MAELHDITTEDQHTILQHMSKVHPDNIHQGLDHLIRKGILSPEQAGGVIEKIGKAQKENETAASKEPEIEKPPTASASVKPPKDEKPKEDQTITQAEDKITPKSDLIEPTEDLRTMNYGNLIGKQQTKKVDIDVNNAILQGRTKIGGNGDSFDSFLKRILPPFQKALKESPDHTILSTHSSVVKAYTTWNNMGRPDPNTMSKEQKLKLATEYNKESVSNGDVEDFKGDNGTIHAVRHGETEDNKKNVFRHPDTELTDKGIKQAQQAGEELKGKMPEGHVPNIISSDMPRAIHTSNIMHQVLQGKKGIDYNKIVGAADPEAVEQFKSNPTNGGINDFLDHLQKNRAIKRG